MSTKYTGKQAKIIVDGTSLAIKEVVATEGGTLEEAVDTDSPTVSLDGGETVVIEEKEPVGATLQLSVTCFHKTNVAVHTLIKWGKLVQVSLLERTTKQWSTFSARVTSKSLTWAPKKLVEYKFALEATTAWTRPAS